MKKIFEKIKNSKKSTKILAVVLATAVCVTSVWHNVGDKPLEVNAETADADKSYLSYVIDRIVGGLQENFTILEIVPHTAYGEFRYYIGDDSVDEGLQKDQTLLKTYFSNLGFYIDTQTGLWKGGKGDAYDTPYEIVTTFSNFGYTITLNSDTDKFEVESPKRFLNYVVPEEKDILEERIVLKTVEANDLTEADILAADFVVISTGKHDNNTVNCYDAFTGNTTGNYNTYSKSVASDGTVTYTEITDQSGLTYNTYEKVSVTAEDGTVTESYVSRDMSWENVEYMWEYLIRGKQIELSDGSVVTTAVPVIMDNQGFSALNTDGNMYKFELIFRMCDVDLLDALLPYISTTYVDDSGVTQQYINCEDLVTGVLSTDKTFTSSTSVKLNRDDIYKICGGSSSSTDIYRDANPPHATFLTNDYWVYSGDSCLIPSTMNNTYFSGTSSDEAGFYDRVGSSATVIDVMRYLLGAKDPVVVRHAKVNILEIEPCAYYSYDEYSEVYALAKKMLLDVDGVLENEDGSKVFDALTESNYNDPDANTCIYVECMPSAGFNGTNVDIVATYDAIIMGMNDDILTQDSDGKTVYNDETLNGYIYLAFGDYIKAMTGISVYYPEDYVNASSFSSGSYTLMGDSTDWNDRSSNKMSYTRVYKINEKTKSMWNPLLYNEFYKNNTYYVLENVSNIVAEHSTNAEMFADYEAGSVRLSENDITQLKCDQLKEFVDSGKPIVMADDLYNFTSASKTVYPTSNAGEIAQYAIDKGGNRVRESRAGATVLYLKNRNPVLNVTSKPTEVAYDSTTGTVNTFNATGTALKFEFTINGRVDTNYKVSIYVDKNNDGVFDKNSKENLENDLNERFYDGTFVTGPNGDVSVKITANLSDSYSGLMSYMLEVIELSETGTQLPYRTSMTGYTAIKSDKKTQVIKVLQIMPATSSSSGNNRPGGGGGGGNSSITLDLETDADFQALLQQAAGTINYDIKVNSIYTYEYEEWFETVPYDGSDDTNHLAPYDMVVIGFANIYAEDDVSNDDGALQCIYDFIDAGRAVLFAHDTIYFPHSVNNFTYSSSSISRDGMTNYSATSLSRMFRVKVGMDRYGITEAESLTASEIDNVAYYADGSPVLYGLAGVTNMLAYVRSYGNNVGGGGKGQSSSSTVSWATSPTTGLYKLYPYKEPTATTATTIDLDEFMETREVKKLNDGQVTMYPYQITDTLEVANTHAQWYQLDMEDEDIVVWYTLADDDVSSTGSSNYYGYSDMDARNNYYIYSKGNITYSGAGHSTMDSPEELKLFVNTVIKAITAGNNVPEVNVVESSYGNGVYNAYVTPYAGTYEFTFYGEDLDLLPYVGRFKSASVTWLNSSSSTPLDIDGDGVAGEVGDDDIVYDMGNTLTNLTRVNISIGNGTVFDAYYDEISELIDSGEGARFYIRLTDMYDDAGEVTLVLRKRELFDLD